MTTELVKKYTKSLIDTLPLQQHEKLLPILKKIKNNLQNYKNILNHPLINYKIKLELLESISGEKFSPTLKKFFSLILSKNKWQILNYLPDEFENQILQLQNKKKVFIETAFPLTTQQKTLIKDALKKWLKRGRQAKAVQDKDGEREREKNDIVLEIKLNPDLIAGISLKIDDFQFESNIKNLLTNFLRQLKFSQ